MKISNYILFLTVLCLPFFASGQFAVRVSKVQTSGKTAIVPLILENRLTEKIDSAKATAFVMDEHGKILGRSTKWIVTDQGKLSLAPGFTNSFAFVIPLDTSTAILNLSIKLSINRAVFEGGKLVDVTKDATVHYEDK